MEKNMIYAYIIIVGIVALIGLISIISLGDSGFSDETLSGEARRGLIDTSRVDLTKEPTTKEPVSFKPIPLFGIECCLLPDGEVIFDFNVIKCQENGGLFILSDSKEKCIEYLTPQREECCIMHDAQLPYWLPIGDCAQMGGTIDAQASSAEECYSGCCVLSNNDILFASFEECLQTPFMTEFIRANSVEECRALVDEIVDEKFECALFTDVHLPSWIPQGLCPLLHYCTGLVPEAQTMEDCYSGCCFLSNDEIVFTDRFDCELEGGLSFIFAQDEAECKKIDRPEICCSIPNSPNLWLEWDKCMVQEDAIIIPFITNEDECIAYQE